MYSYESCGQIDCKAYQQTTLGGNELTELCLKFSQYMYWKTWPGHLSAMNYIELQQFEQSL